jgi:hypothetical protein
MYGGGGISSGGSGGLFGKKHSANGNRLKSWLKCTPSHIVMKLMRDFKAVN